LDILPEARIAVGPISDSGRPKLLADALAERSRLSSAEVGVLVSQ
jgi:hypothetical protein